MSQKEMSKKRSKYNIFLACVRPYVQTLVLQIKTKWLDHKEVTSQVCEGLFAGVLKQRDSALAKMFPRFHHAHVLKL